jgi:hypothetical protein
VPLPDVDHSFVDYGVDIKQLLPVTWRVHRMTQVRGVVHSEAEYYNAQPPVDVQRRPQKLSFTSLMIKKHVILLAYFRAWQRYA